MSELIPIVSKDEIDKRVSVIAEQISDDYAGKDLILIGILKGSFIFLADLARKLTIPVKIDFVRASSYGTSSKTSGQINITKEPELDLKNKDLLLVEDIVDTGLTLVHLKNHLQSFKPRSIKICALIDKPERRKLNVELDYVCHKIETGFLVGYGLDYAENYRYLPAIYHLKL